MKRAFLFGAGAESNFNLSCGPDFARKILISKEPSMKDINAAIKDYYKKTKKDMLDSWYPPYAAEGWNESQLVRAALTKKYLDVASSEDIKKNKDDISKDNISKEVKRLMNSDDPTEKEELLKNCTSYMGLADARYHTLIHPKFLGPKLFWSVINCYIRAYLLITGQMFKSNEVTFDYSEILKNPADTYGKLVEIANKRKDENSYYKKVRELAPNSLVITTNYTPYAKIITEQETINIHGDFSLFESARELRVYDVKDKEVVLPEKEVLFPYISIQGGVKPIIERKQMITYGHMVSKLSSEINQLVILGYGINSDDNHLNSVIRSFLVEDKKSVVYFDYSDGREDAIRIKLRLSKEESLGLKYIPLNKKDAVQSFADFLENNA